MLKNEQITLRPLKQGDAKLLYAWRNELLYIKYTKSIRLPKHEGMEEEWVSKVMLDKSDRDVIFIMQVEEVAIGLIQLTQIDWISKNCYFGIALGELSYKGKGYGQIASKLLFDYAFNHLNIHKISVEIASFNQNSIEMHKKLGFQLEGTLREQYFWDNKYHDVQMLGLLKTDYK